MLRCENIFAYNRSPEMAFLQTTAGSPADDAYEFLGEGGRSASILASCHPGLISVESGNHEGSSICRAACHAALSGALAVALLSSRHSCWARVGFLSLFPRSCDRHENWTSQAALASSRRRSHHGVGLSAHRQTGGGRQQPSRRLGMPSGLSLPFAFGMYTRRAGIGLYEPANSSSRIVASSSWRCASIMRLSTPSTPGVRAPLDASVIRAASLSHALSATSLRSRSNLRPLSSVDHAGSLLCISLIIKGVHLTMVS